MNCVSKMEGQRELIQGFQNVMKDERQTDRATVRHTVTNSKYKNATVIHLSRTV
jgi:hypothetical protein